MVVEPLRAEGVHERADLLLVRIPGTKTAGAPASRNALPRWTASAAPSFRVRGPGPQERVGAGVEHEVRDPLGSAAFMTASTWAAASASGFIWSSMLAPTMPAPIALRTVSGASP